MAEESENSELVRLSEQHAKIADDFASMKQMMTVMCRKFTAAQTTHVPVGIEGFVLNAQPHEQGKSSVDNGNSRISAYEHLIELNERLTKEVKNLKQWVFEQNERSIEEVKDLKQFVVELYHAVTVGHAPPPMPSNLSGIAPTIVHQAHCLSTTFEDPQYSPDSPYYFNASRVAGSSTMCPLAPPHPPVPPSAFASQFTILARPTSLGNEKEKERDPRSWAKRELKQPHSYFQTPQKHHPEQFSPECSALPLHRVRPYAQASSYSRWRAPAPHTTCDTPHSRSQNLPVHPYQKRNNPCSQKKLPRFEKNWFTAIGESYTKLFEKLQQANLLNPIPGKMHPTRKVDHSRRCAFHSGAPGHDTEQCWELKRAIQAMIDNNQISVVEDKTPNVNQNPLSVHDVPNYVGMIGTVFIEEDMRGISIKQIEAVDLSPDIRRHETFIVESAARPSASVVNSTKQDLAIEPIPCLTQSFGCSKETSPSKRFQANELEQKKNVVGLKSCRLHQHGTI